MDNKTFFFSQLGTIFSCRAQNEQLRAEIEAQSIAHKGQINTVEMRAHDSWLAAKQAERRLEEAKSESSVLRKKLTSLTQQFSSAGKIINRIRELLMVFSYHWINIKYR